MWSNDDIAPPWSRAHGVDAMWTVFLLLVACVPIAACSADLVTAPEPPVPTAPTLPIRGPSSVRGSSPLIIVDGVLVGSIDINVVDVESVEIIKAASASTIYGTMVRCPPIVITTRRSPGAPQSRPAIRDTQSGTAASTH